MKAYFALILWGLCVLCGCGGGAKPPIPPLTITTAALPNGISGTPYSQQIQASGGVAPYSWTVSAGMLPHNLALSTSETNSAMISGAPDTAAQAVKFTIQVTDSANQSTSQAYTVSILLAADSVTLSPLSIDFGAQLVGRPSGRQVATLSNTSSSALAINSIATSGTNPADFIDNSTCGSVLAGGADCAIDVIFNPSQSGPRSASVTITDDTAGSPQSFALNGVGLNPGPDATLSATSLTFGSQAVGAGSAPQSLTLSNYGAATLNITGVATTANFSETDNCDSSLSSGASCILSVTFDPSATGSLSGTLSVADNAPSSPQTVSLSGSGVAGQCRSKGEQCYSGHPCCPGLQCVPASTRAFCE